MQSELFSLLTVCGLDEIKDHGAREVTHVLSILDPEWPDPDFGSYQPHRRTVLRFHDIIEPTPGMVLPSREDVEAILGFGRSIGTDHGGAQAHLLVHCHAGISRSTAAMTMILAQARPDQDEVSVLEQVFAIRSKAWPNLRMVEFADDLLGRDGRLAAAAGLLYGRQLAKRPDLAELMTGMGRAREVAIGQARRPDAA